MQGPKNNGTMLSEINVTPLVDVMLVLLIIFMISSSIETLQVQREKERIEEIRKDRPDQKVPVNLPRTDAEPVNLSEERKLVMTINDRAEFYVGRTLVLKCLDLAPSLEKVLGAGRKTWGRKADKAFGPCLDVLGEKLGANAKLQSDKEMYLRADESIPYGMVLKVMARVRRAGVRKFGLIAEPEAPGGK